MQSNILTSYTRQDALDDGNLVDVSIEAAKFGFRAHTCITAALHSFLNADPQEKVYPARLKALLLQGFLAIMRARAEKKDIDLVEFSFGDRHVWLCFNPVEGFTIMFPEDY